MSTAADRGKLAEGKVRTYLKALERADCTHHRFPDAHAGSFVTAPCDFMVMRKGRLTLIEVKQVEHLYRLPHKNFAADQLGRMRNWQFAGAAAWVLIYFAPATAWRLLPADHFLLREGGSWDLREVPTLTLAEAFASLL